MDEKIIATSCLCDDLIKAIEHHESAFPQRLKATLATISTVPFSPGSGQPGSPLRSLPKDGFVRIEKQHRRGGAFDELATGLDFQLR